MPIRMKVYHQGTETLVAAADADLIGKTFREGKLKIEVGKFYEGDVVTEEAFLDHLKLATIGNFVGKETIDAAKRGGYASDEGVLWIGGVPHAQYVLMIGCRSGPRGAPRRPAGPAPSTPGVPRALLHKQGVPSHERVGRDPEEDADPRERRRQEEEERDGAARDQGVVRQAAQEAQGRQADPQAEDEPAARDPPLEEIPAADEDEHHAERGREREEREHRVEGEERRPIEDRHEVPLVDAQEHGVRELPGEKERRGQDGQRDRIAVLDATHAPPGPRAGHGRDARGRDYLCPSARLSRHARVPLSSEGRFDSGGNVLRRVRPGGADGRRTVRLVLRDAAPARRAPAPRRRPAMPGVRRVPRRGRMGPRGLGRTYPPDPRGEGPPEGAVPPRGPRVRRAP